MMINVSAEYISADTDTDMVSVRLGRFMEGRRVLPTTQFAYRKGLGTCDALLCVAHSLQNALEMGQEARIVQIDFSSAFYRATIR